MGMIGHVATRQLLHREGSRYTGFPSFGDLGMIVGVMAHLFVYTSQETLLQCSPCMLANPPLDGHTYKDRFEGGTMMSGCCSLGQHRAAR